MTSRCGLNNNQLMMDGRGIRVENRHHYCGWHFVSFTAYSSIVQYVTAARARSSQGLTDVSNLSVLAIASIPSISIRTDPSPPYLSSKPCSIDFLKILDELKFPKARDFPHKEGNVEKG